MSAAASSGSMGGAPTSCGAVAVAAIMLLGIVNLFGIEAPAALAAEALVR